MVDSWARSPLWVVTISCRLCLICNSLQLDCFLSFSCKLDNHTHPEADCWLFCFIFRILGCNYSGNLSRWFRKFQMGHELAESGMTTGPIWHLSFLQTNTFFSRFDSIISNSKLLISEDDLYWKFKSSLLETNTYNYK